MAKEIFEDFDTELFKAPPSEESKKKFLTDTALPDDIPEKINQCPYYPVGCYKSGTSQCSIKCERHPDNFMDEKVKKVFEETPWACYCFDCDCFVSGVPHEDSLETPEPICSHVVVVGFYEYRTKISEYVLKRMNLKKEKV
jgi:hypothetical protein